ncbi:MAG TPA: serine hydrolase [Roseiarcus sp.]|nr:serine hydrolase [Roseiarcus sp.]
MAWLIGQSQLIRVVRLAAGVLIGASALALAGAPAEARHYRHVHSYAHAHYYRHVADYSRHYARRWTPAPVSPAFSAIVVDANSGRTLYCVAEDGLRHPASITKVMTLYLLFEELDKGAMTLQTRIPVSEHAAAQEPSKLGVEPGGTISVEDAIKAVVTRSANDMAVAIAEAIGHDESTFAEIMTRKAHALGMSNTLYRNASGLPNDEQVTTARDLAILGRSLEERFPRYFRYFSTRQFDYAGETIGNHNHLLGRVDGVDGIKTGYTRASGFNLLTSVHRDGRSLIAVVMGGRSAGWRDRVMENLIDDHIAEASTIHTATMVADASRGEQQPARPAAQPDTPRPHPAVVAANVPARTASARAAPPPVAEGDNSEEDGAPALRVAAVQPRAAAPAPVLPRAVDQARVASIAAEQRRAEPSESREEPTPAQLGWVKGPDAVRKGPASTEANTTPPAKRKAAETEAHGSAPAAAETTVAARTPAELDDDGGAASRKGWVIQIGATDDAAKATALLDKARQRSRSLLASAKPVTEKVRKGEDTFYRARFAGLDSASAETACRSLKRSGFSCFAARD